jgi:molybdopterin-containing oxidoreductase family iron-sulfur binding subunit
MREGTVTATTGADGAFRFDGVRRGLTYGVDVRTGRPVGNLKLRDGRVTAVALAGMTACRRWPSETIVPLAHRPPGYVPGCTLQYATSFELGGAATGLLVTSYDGRPIKIEGNPSHPQSLGATDPLAQATVLQLYDPDRSSELVLRAKGGESATRDRDAFAAWAGPHFASLRASGGQGLRVLSEPSSSPTLSDLKARFSTTFPKAVWVEWDPLSRDAAREGAAMAFGRPVRTHLALEKADVIAAFDADILCDDPEALANARAWARRRRAGDGTMNRLYAIEAAYSLTGGSADHRLPVASGLVPVVLGRLAAKLLEGGVKLPAGTEGIGDAVSRYAAHPHDDPRIAVLAKDLASDSLDPVPRDRMSELLGRGDPQPRLRGPSRQAEENEEGTGHAMPVLIDFEVELAGTEAGGACKRAVRAVVVRARDACAPLRDAGQGHDAPPWCSCARGTRGFSCAGGCSVETCASYVRFLKLQGESGQSTEGSAECQARL